MYMSAGYTADIEWRKGCSIDLDSRVVKRKQRPPSARLRSVCIVQICQELWDESDFSDYAVQPLSMTSCEDSLSHQPPASLQRSGALGPRCLIQGTCATLDMQGMHQGQKSDDSSYASLPSYGVDADH